MTLGVATDRLVSFGYCRPTQHCNGVGGVVSSRFFVFCCLRPFVFLVYLDPQFTVFVVSKYCCAPPGTTQAFVDEMTGIAQMKWLDDFKTTNDKKGLIAKVAIMFMF